MAHDPPRRLAWITDPHLNFVRAPGRARFYESVAERSPDAVLLGGDAGEANDLERYLHEMEDALRVPIYFVLGNHDCYRSSVRHVEELAARLSRESSFLRYLPEAGVVELADGAALVGHGGWADGRFGDYMGSTVQLSDHFLIGELLGLGKLELRAVLRDLGDEAAARLRGLLDRALEGHERVIVLTHVPPFQEAAWHEGKMSDPDYLPHFSSKASGDAILEALEGCPRSETLVLCGHTHGEGELQVRPGLRVITGGAVYGRPAVQGMFELPEPFAGPSHGPPGPPSSPRR